MDSMWSPWYAHRPFFSLRIHPFPLPRSFSSSFPPFPSRRQHEPHLNRGRAHLSHRRRDPAPPSLPLPPRQLHPLRPSFLPPRPRQAGGATCSHLKYPSETVPTCEATTRPLRTTAPGGQYHYPSPFALTRSGSNPAGILNRRLYFEFKSRPNDGVGMYVCVQSKKNEKATSGSNPTAPSTQWLPLFNSSRPCALRGHLWVADDA